MSKKKNKAKTTKREKFEKSYALKRFDNPVVKSWGKILNDSNPLVFTSLIRDLFGKKTGQKILDKINTCSKANEALISICKECESSKPVEDIPENKISWKRIDEFRTCRCNYLNDEEAEMFKKLNEVLSMGIVNETIKNINVQLEFRSPYYSGSMLVCIPRSIMKEVSTLSELSEVIYSLVYEELAYFTKNAMSYVEEEMSELPEIIKDEYNRLNDMTYSGAVSSEVYGVMSDIMTDVSLVLAKSMGLSIHDYGYTPEFLPKILTRIGASETSIGVHVVSVVFINERDKEDIGEYRTVYPPKNTFSKALYNSMCEEFSKARDTEVADIPEVVTDVSDETTPEETTSADAAIKTDTDTE